MISDQRGNSVWNIHPEKLKCDAYLFRAISRVVLLMVPRGNRNSAARKVVKKAMMNLITTEISHISLLFPEKPPNRQIGQTSFFNSFSQDGLFRTFIGFDRSRRNLYPSLRNINVTKNEQAILMGNVRKCFLLGFFHDQRVFLFPNH